MQLIGQRKNVDMLDRWKELPNFIILQGDKHSGKTYFAQYISDRFNMTYVRLNNGINEVRNLVDLMYAGANVLYHFKDFDGASQQAKNALLKITEETPSGNTILISGNRQIKTLESRARKLVMSAYTDVDMMDIIIEYFGDKKWLYYYRAGFNTPSKVIMYKDFDGIDALLQYAYDVVDKLPFLSYDIIVHITQTFEAKYDNIDSAILFLDMLVNIINYKTKNELNLRFSYYKILNKLILCKEDLIRDKVLNRKFYLYRTFYEIKELGGVI